MAGWGEMALPWHVPHAAQQVHSSTEIMGRVVMIVAMMVILMVMVMMVTTMVLMVMDI